MNKNYIESTDWLFSVAPMMDGTGTYRKAKHHQHLSRVAETHVVPNVVPPLVRSIDEQAISRSCVSLAVVRLCAKRRLQLH
jgi:hypothetical protein